MAEILWALGLAGFAGFVKYLQRFAVKKEERPSWEWGQVGIAVVTSCLAGLLALWSVGKNLEPNYARVFFILAGYAGPLVFEFGWEVVKGVISRAAQNPKDDGSKG